MQASVKTARVCVSPKLTNFVPEFINKAVQSNQGLINTPVIPGVKCNAIIPADNIVGYAQISYYVLRNKLHSIIVIFP